MAHLAGGGDASGKAGESGVELLGQNDNDDEDKEMDPEERRVAMEQTYGKMEADKPRLLEEVKEEEEEGKGKEKGGEKEGEKGKGEKTPAPSEAAAEGADLQEGYAIVEEDYDEEMELWKE